MDGVYLISKDELKGKVILMIPPEIPVPEGCPRIESTRGTVVTIKKAALQELIEEYKNKGLNIKDYILYKG